MVSLQNMGNSRARAVYEAQLPDGFRRPQTDSALESFIRAKYEHKKYMAREWVPAGPAKVNWDKEIDEEMDKQKRKKKSTSSSSSSSTSSSSMGITALGNTDKKPVSSVSLKSPIPAPLPKPTTTGNSPKTTRTTPAVAPVSSDSLGSGTLDLLGLSSPVTNNGQHKTNSNLNDLTGATDVFSNFLSAAPVGAGSGFTDITNSTSNGSANTAKNTSLSLAKEEEDFFNQVPSEKDNTKMTKDSILALYGTAPLQQPSIGQFNGGFNQFGSTPGGFPPPQQMQMGGFNPQQFNAGATMIGNVGVQNQNYLQQAQPGASGLGFGQPMFGPTSGLGGFPIHQSQQQIPPNTYTMQSFAQFPPNSTATINTFPLSEPFAQTQPQTAANSTINKQFANLNIGNVWQ